MSTFQTLSLSKVLQVFYSIGIVTLLANCVNTPVESPPATDSVAKESPPPTDSTTTPAPGIRPPPLYSPPQSSSLPVTPPVTAPWAWLNETTPVPGGIAWLHLNSQSNTPPDVRYRERRVTVLPVASGWIAVIGIPLDTRLGQHTVIDQGTGERYAFEVFDKQYKTQHIRLKNRRQVSPEKSDVDRIRQETAKIKAALASPWRPTLLSPLPLLKPVAGRFGGTFGLRRYFNGEARKPHSGLDIVAAKNTPIVAAADGVIVNTGSYFFNGNTVFIDHGQSIVTVYCHLQDILVDVGQVVVRGQTIGTVGQSGRATGPHLHWGVSMNNTMIDPLLVLQR